MRTISIKFNFNWRLLGVNWTRRGGSGLAVVTSWGVESHVCSVSSLGLTVLGSLAHFIEVGLAIVAACRVFKRLLPVVLRAWCLQYERHGAPLFLHVDIYNLMPQSVGLYRRIEMARKRVAVWLPESCAASFKDKCSRSGTSMSAVLKAAISEFMSGEEVERSED